MNYEANIKELATTIQNGTFPSIGGVLVTGPVNFWIVLKGTGAVSATVDILVSPDGDTLKETSILSSPLVLSGTTLVTKFSEKVTITGFFRFKVTAIGAGTSVNVAARN